MTKIKSKGRRQISKCLYEFDTAKTFQNYENQFRKYQQNSKLQSKIQNDDNKRQRIKLKSEMIKERKLFIDFKNAL